MVLLAGFCVLAKPPLLEGVWGRLGSVFWLLLPYLGEAGWGPLGFGLHHQIGFNKPIQFSIHYGLHIAHFVVGAVVFYHFVGMEHIAADLRAPFYFAFAG